MWTLDREGLHRGQTVEGEIIEFAHVHNGTGFSVAAQRRAASPNLALIASGPLIPDQARLAFQVGFDAVLIEDGALTRHGEDAWRGALAASLGATYTYASARATGEQSLWAQRQSTAT